MQINLTSDKCIESFQYIYLVSIRLNGVFYVEVTISCSCDRYGHISCPRGERGQKCGNNKKPWILEKTHRIHGVSDKASSPLWMAKRKEDAYGNGHTEHCGSVIQAATEDRKGHSSFFRDL